MSEESRNDRNSAPDPAPYRPPVTPMPVARAPMHWALKLLLVVGAIIGIVLIGIVVLAGLVLATCALGR